MYNPFKKKKPDWLQSSQTFSLPQDTIGRISRPQYPTQQKENQTKMGLYDQYGKQIGSSEDRHIVHTPNMSIDRSPQMSIDRSPQLPPQMPSQPNPRNNAQPKPSMPSYFSGYQTVADRKRRQAAERQARMKDYYDKAYAERNRLLQESIPKLESQFNKTKGYFQQGLDTARQRAEYAKGNIEDEYGTLQRQAAQTRKESANRIAGRFAQLNTGDSWGYGSHRQAQENIESDFNRFTQENLKKKQQQKFEIDSNLQDYELKAQQKIDELAGNLESTIAQIQSNINMNNLDKQNAMDEVVAKYEDALNAVDTDMNKVYENYYNQLAELEKDSLSEGFMKNRVPETETDFRFMYDHPDEYADIIGGGQTTTQTKQKQKALDLVDQLLNANTEGLTGRMRFGWSDESRNTEGILKQLSAELQLEEARRMKGQGQMSDSERQILKDAIASFNLDANGRPRVTNERFQQILREMKQGLMQKGAKSNFATKVKVMSPTGEIGSIDEAELDEALQNGYRRI